jgi:hypothetical protein
MLPNNNPVREIRSIVNDSGVAYTNRILVGTATTGLVRVEWVAARYSQIIPMNWSQVQVNEYISASMPLHYQVDDAQNLMVKQCLVGDFEWLFLLEHDVMLPDNALVLLNQYLMDGEIPIVSGLYYSRSRPSEPLAFRGRGNGVYKDWQHGDKVWVDGVPTGCLLIHHSILKLMWAESPEYVIRNQVVRRVFETPRKAFYDDNGQHNTISGTSDLYWCDRVMRENVIERAGWKVPDPKNPFMLDTNLFCKHINMSGEQFP